MIETIDQYRTIGIVGVSKNSGKTTTLNALIDRYKHESLGLTSIGLDGESLDQVNFLPKPKIKVYPNMVVATAQSCLDDTTIDYRILCDTPYHTPLGKIRLALCNSEGFIMLAGPSTNEEMNMVLKLLKLYVHRIFVDGALSRQTFSAIHELEGIILATGAAFSPVMAETVYKTKHMIDIFRYPKTTYKIPTNYVLVMQCKNQMVMRQNKSHEAMKQVFMLHKDEIDWLYIRGAITDRLIDLIVDYRIKNITLIIDDPTKLLFHHRYHMMFEKLNIRVEVIKNVPLLLITINPFSPIGQPYEIEKFKTEIQKLSTIPVINVKDLEV